MKKELTPADLGYISYKAAKSWEYFGFGRKAKPGTLCAMYGWDCWHAYELESGEILLVDEGGVEVTMLRNKEKFIEWLELTYDEREQCD